MGIHAVVVVFVISKKHNINSLSQGLSLEFNNKGNLVGDKWLIPGSDIFNWRSKENKMILTWHQPTCVMEDVKFAVLASARHPPEPLELVPTQGV